MTIYLPILYANLVNLKPTPIGRNDRKNRSLFDQISPKLTPKTSSFWSLKGSQICYHQKTRNLAQAAGLYVF